MSIVVVSVFIIFITVAAVAITWFWIVPWTQDIEVSEDMNVNLRVVLEGYTAYDVEHEMAFVQINRGADAANVVALDVIFSVRGDSFVFRTKDAPSKNQMGLYYFNFSAEGIVGAPQLVEIAPVFSEGISEELGIAMGQVTIPSKRVVLDDWDLARVKAEDNVLKRDVVEDVVSEPVSICKHDFDAGEVYVLDKSYSLFSGSNCFEIYVDDVVLDLNGYLILGNYSGYGVYITGSNVTVKNGRIERFEKGIFVDGVGADNNTIVDNHFFDNNNSVYLWLSNGNFVSGNEMSDGNYTNIYLRNAYENHVADNWACGSPGDVLCENTDSSNYGAGNTFSSVVGCSGEVWSVDIPGSYTQCED